MALEQLKIEEQRSSMAERGHCPKKVFYGCATILLLTVLAVTVVVLSIIALNSRQNEDGSGILASLISEKPKLTNALQALQTKGSLSDKRLHINVGNQNNLLLCNGPDMRLTFPDLDYALLGYDILKGYPLAVGHDPGFTYPIFVANYSENKHTSDCRYLLPRGLVLIPDVACITSFSSKIIRTKLEVSQSLSVSASVEGGGWGAKFSASAGYKEASSSVSTGEYTFIRSTAKCRYYYSKIDQTSPPPLSSGFMKWARHLNEVDESDTDEYHRFFEYFGTHFLIGSVFGAKFIYEHKMESSKMEEMRSSGVNVAVSASYSGAVSVGGGFSLDSQQRQSAANFQKNVETSTITIGAPPPANGDALTWASNVKDTPVPIEYKLSSIEALFSDTYMKNAGIDFEKITRAIKRHKTSYCDNLRQKGLVDNCEEVATQGIYLRKTGLTRKTLDEKPTEIRPTFKAFPADRLTCIMECLERSTCVAAEYCTECKGNSPYYMQCYLYSDYEQAVVRGVNKADFETLIFPSKVDRYLKLQHTNIVGTYINLEETNDNQIQTIRECMALCFKSVKCIAFTFCKCPLHLRDDITKCRCANKSPICKTYESKQISSLKKEPYTNTYILSRVVNSVNQTMEN